MNKAFSLFVALSLVCSIAPAAAKSSINRGGFGTLFADTNHFNNPGLFSQLRGFSFSGDFYKDIDEEEVTANSSAVIGNGRFGLGVFAERKGYVLNDPALGDDTVGGGFGMNFAKGMGMVGVNYTRSMAEVPLDDGKISTFVTFQKPGKGFSIGVGGGTTLNADVDKMNAIGAIGYSFNPMVQFEGTFEFPDITVFTDWKAGGFLNITGKMLYAAGGFTYWTSYERKAILGRLGIVLGNVFDISGYASKVIGPATSIAWGGNLRVRL